jgi:chemotaxis protein histidine kinase CheA
LPPIVTVLPVPTPPEPADVAARRLLAFHERLPTLSSAERAQTQARLAASGSPDDTLALALLLGQTRQPGDLSRALALLDPLARDAPAPATEAASAAAAAAAAAATTISPAPAAAAAGAASQPPAQASEPASLRAPATPAAAASPPHAALARLLRSRLAEQRRLEELAERQAQQLREQQRRLDQLSQQLDALRAIERSLGTRPAAPPAPRTP